MEVSGHLNDPAALPQGKSPWYPLDRRLGGPQSRSGRGGEEKSSQTLPGLELPTIQPVFQRYTTELSVYEGEAMKKSSVSGGKIGSKRVVRT
jgi:hypothetical protein